jgi:anti-sigma B factor antagonist
VTIERTERGLALRGELDAATAPEVEIALREALLETEGSFVLDLSGLDFMDSGGINAMLQARALFAREERALTLVCPPGPARRVLEIAGVTELFTLV